MDYHNKIGIVTDIDDLRKEITIDGKKYSLEGKYRFNFRGLFDIKINDKIQYNFNSQTNEIIYLKNISKRLIGSNYKEADVQGPAGLSKIYQYDPHDIHDMGIVYGSEFDGM